ncbi:MAG TPA: hypothetical protein VFQ62_20895 [Methylomirabilota bacterium]|nr:hypothetical protein [Methylomirabilota bacterium]
MRRQILGWAAVVVLLLVGTPALAHVRVERPDAFTSADVETLTDGGVSMDGLAPLLAAVAAGVTLVARRRRAVAMVCTALLLLVAFEAGVHSVHHLTDQPASQCVIASASSHTGAVVVAPVAFDRPMASVAALALAPTTSPTARSDAPDLGRAPPIA